jgi:hypothetical protein
VALVWANDAICGVSPQHRLVSEEMENQMVIRDEIGRTIEVGMRVGCRNTGEPREMSRRGLTLLGYEPDSDRPYITDAGRFGLALKDHQPDMDQWIASHVR